MPIVVNKAPHHKMLPPPHVKQGEDGLKPHVLFPGANEVGEAEWEAAKKLPVIKAYLEADPPVLVVIVPAGKKKPAASLSDLKETEQLKLVKDTTDLDLLAGWREKAPTAVLKAIDARVDELKAPPKGK